MKKILLILSLLFYIFTNINNPIKAQSILRYNYDTYKGKPIYDGWLMKDTTYKQIYDKLNFQKDLIITYKKIIHDDSTIIINKEKIISYKDSTISDLKKQNLDCSNKFDSAVAKSDSLYNLGKNKITKKQHKKVVRRTVFQAGGVGVLVGIIVTLYVAFKLK
jgi:hypothetical protein